MQQLVSEESSTQAELSIAQMCRTLSLNRAEYYRWKSGSLKSDAAQEIRTRIQQIALAWPSYGTRRIRCELQRQGLAINRKRVQRLMREDNLLCSRMKYEEVYMFEYEYMREARSRIGEFLATVYNQDTRCD